MRENDRTHADVQSNQKSLQDQNTLKAESVEQFPVLRQACSDKLCEMYPHSILISTIL